MTNPNYSNAFSVLGAGSKELCLCMWNSIIKNSKEISIGAVHHWFFSIILIGLFVGCFLTTLKSRVERDEACKKEFILQQQNDSMKCALDYDKTTNKH